MPRNTADLESKQREELSTGNAVKQVSLLNHSGEG